MQNLPPGIKRITVLRRDPTGILDGVVVCDEPVRRRKPSKRLGRFEKALTRMVHERANASIIYLDRHRRSNEKKKNGWLKDMPSNIRTASLKAKKNRKRLLTLKGLSESRSGGRRQVSASVYRVAL